MIDIAALTKPEHHNKTVLEILALPIDGLRDVSAVDRALIERLDVWSIYDLAASRIFTAADLLSRHGAKSIDFLASDLLDNDWSLTAYKSLAAAPVNLIQGIGEQLSTELTRQLSINTVGDLANWAPFRAARLLYEAADQEVNDSQTDEGLSSSTAQPDDHFHEPPSAPSEFIPMLGQHATEQRFYSQVYLDHMLLDDEPAPSALPRAVDVMEALTTNTGFHLPALGAVLTLSQDWTPQALALGTVLHSMTLAPGEVTKIAVVEWSRRSAARTQEDLAQREKVSASLDQRQAIDEVQNGVVTEELSGRSKIHNKSETEQFGAGLGVSGGGAQSTGAGADVGLPGAATGLPADFGLSASQGSNLSAGLTGGLAYGSGSIESTTNVVTSSRGRRDMHLDMRNRVTSGTRQQASSARSRRAAIVQEISQSEDVTLKTRVVANYNHMHALTMYYYEVIQIYRTRVRPHRVEPVLFIPFQLLDFQDDSVVTRFRTTLLNAALNDRDRDLIQQASGIVRVITDLGPRQEIEIPGGAKLRNINMGLGRARIDEVLIELEGDEPPMIVTPENLLQMENGPRLSTIRNISLKLNDKSFDDLKKELPRFYNSPDSFTRFVLNFGFSAGERMNWVRTVGNIASTPLPMHTVFKVRAMLDDAGIVATLSENRLHYSQAVWRALDAQSMAQILSQIRVDRYTAGELVDPTPVALHGNMVGFRLSLPEDARFRIGDIDDIGEWWQDWKVRNFDPNAMEDSLVPMPTGGVHGEAVLGQSNAAEKLDITRFWNWQDSPIPILPSEIAPLQAGAREVAQAPTPGSFDAPVVSIQNAPPMPGAQGFGAISSVLGQPGLFRDPTGIAQAGDITTTGIAAATDAAASAQEASTRFAALAAEVDKARIAASSQMASTAMQAAGQARNSISRSGAHLNDVAKHGSAVDRQKAGEAERDPVGTEHKQGSQNLDKAAEQSASKKGNTGSSSSGSEKTGESATKKKKRDDPKTDRHILQISPTRVLLFNFATGKDALHPDHKAALKTLAAQVTGPDSIARLGGRASKLGDADDNKQLSEDRSKAVMEALLAFSKLKVEGPFNDPAIIKAFGENKPIRDSLNADDVKDIPKGDGTNDPLERSVLVEFAAPVDVQKKPQKVKVGGGVVFNLIGKLVEFVDQDIRLVFDNSDKSSNSTEVRLESKLDASDRSKTVNEGDSITRNEGDRVTHIHLFPNGLLNVVATNNKLVVGNTTINVNDGAPKVSGDAPTGDMKTRDWSMQFEKPSYTAKSLIDVINEQIDSLVESSGGASFTIFGVEINGDQAVAELKKKIKDALIEKIAKKLPVGFVIDSLKYGKIQFNATIFVASHPNQQISGTFSSVGFVLAATDQDADSKDSVIVQGGIYKTKDEFNVNAWPARPPSESFFYAEQGIEPMIGSLASFFGDLTSEVTGTDVGSGLSNAFDSFIDSVKSVLPTTGNKVRFTHKKGDDQTIDQEPLATSMSLAAMGMKRKNISFKKR